MQKITTTRHTEVTMSKQTAVEWLAKELESYGDPQFCEIEWEQLDSLIKQAKAIEKEQAQLYATFCLRCINEKLPVIRFEDWIKTNNKTI